MFIRARYIMFLKYNIRDVEDRIVVPQTVKGCERRNGSLYKKNTMRYSVWWNVLYLAKAMIYPVCDIILWLARLYFWGELCKECTFHQIILYVISDNTMKIYTHLNTNKFSVKTRLVLLRWCEKQDMLVNESGHQLEYPQHISMYLRLSFGSTFNSASC